MTIRNKLSPIAAVALAIAFVLSAHDRTEARSSPLPGDAGKIIAEQARPHSIFAKVRPRRNGAYGGPLRRAVLPREAWVPERNPVMGLFRGE